MRNQKQIITCMRMWGNMNSNFCKQCWKELLENAGAENGKRKEM